MTPAELKAASRLGASVFTSVVSRVEQVHQAVAGRAFGQIRRPGTSVSLIHDTVARGVYRAIGGAGSAAAKAGGQAVMMLGIGGRPADSTPGGNLALATLNAVAGDRLGADLAPLAIGMSVRAGGRDVALSSGALAAAFPHATTRLAVFVHGLAETENSWGRRDDDHAPYGQRLAEEFGYTPVYIRYNTGRHVSDNGRDLALLLGSLLGEWPERVDELLLIGHSMGGLVIRSACHDGARSAAAWVRQVRHVFYLGSPHLGAPLARAAGLAGWALGQVAETRPFVTLVNGSSSGIKDLRHGYLRQDDWAGCDMDRCRRDHRQDTPLLAGASHYAISATITADPASKLGAVTGDLLVTPASAHGRRGYRQHVAFPAESGRSLGGMHHLDLLNHPEVWRTMRRLLGGAG
ncbi:MAG TPA: hypothetical protein VN840_18580 [Streptosporangiaceae bacterium]|nr:hypothetical protein [Streptosporangiaceae bacterium]